MTIRIARAALLLMSAVLTAAPAFAQSNYNAQWVWHGVKTPGEAAPAGTVWFRREVRGTEPSTGAVRILCDDRFSLWVNGQKIGDGGADKVYRFSLNGIAERGLNVIAVEASNKGGAAGLFVDGEIRGQSGGVIPFDSGADWKATATKPKSGAWTTPGFDDTAWDKVVVIGPHDKSPWKELALQDSFLDRFEVAPGLELKRVGEPELTKSLVCITWGNRGRLLASQEQGPIVSLIDDNGDGTFDRSEEFSADVKNCQGLCMIGKFLYAVGTGKEGAGVYLLTDIDQDDKAESAVLLAAHKGNMGEHGPHDIVYGPDGWLYHNLGNHAWVTAEPQPTTAVRNYEEGYLLQPKFEDAGGHAVGIKAPGGTVWRFSPDGKKWWCETNGFRNHYDIAFNSLGDLFTFDSDMEWDVGQPWYRPVRVNHCTPGAEFGWRSGAAKWPESYFDSLPTTVDIGRGSPTGVVMYEHRALPEKYRGSLLACDWSMGRLMAVILKPQGATYTGTYENLVTGNPLNVSDVEVDRDGSIVFCTGGRRTEGGVFRLKASGARTVPVNATTVAEVLALPQTQSNWAREMAAAVSEKDPVEWGRALTLAAKTGSPEQRVRALSLLTQYGPKPSVELLTEASVAPDSRVRAFSAWLLGDHDGEPVRKVLSRLLSDPSATVQRRACEAFVRSGIEAPVEPLIKLLASTDRFLSFAARLALERVPVAAWKDKVLAAEPGTRLLGLLALHRLGKDAMSSSEALEEEFKLLTILPGKKDAAAKRNLLRMIQLTLMRGELTPTAGEIGLRLIEEFPTGDGSIDAEAARLLCFLQVPGTAERVVKALETAPTPAAQIHYALTLRYLNSDWTFPLKRRYLDWYEGTRAWEGGHSFAPYLANIVGGGMERLDSDERRALLLEWRKRPFAAGLIIATSQPDQVPEFEKLLTNILTAPVEAGDRDRLEGLVSRAIEALGRNPSAETLTLLRTLYDNVPDRRPLLARALANSPTSANWPHFVKALSTDEPTTLQLLVKAMRQTPEKSAKPEEVRAVILAALRIGSQGSGNAVALLQEMTQLDHKKGKDAAAAIALYQEWYAKTFPDAPPPELPKDDGKTKFTFAQLVQALDGNSDEHAGDVERGKAVFTKAKCIKCHRFLKEGDTIGPDLTSLRRRFQRKEIIESLVYPSQVISDQYRMVTIVTTEGLVHNGMAVPGNDNSDKITLLLQDATKIEIPKSKVEETVKSKLSVMPAGLLNDLTLEDLADLFAFLETSKYNEPPPMPAAGGN